MSNESINTITFKYKFPENYNPKYVNGAYGGIGPRGELVINFYLERQPIPKEETYQLLEDNKLGNSIARIPEDLQYQVIRFVETGIILNLESAKRILDWLVAHVKSLEQIQSGVKSG
jgi:hypothetical protein